MASAPNDGTGSYEVLHARLAAQARELRENADALNARRRETFGGGELQIVGSERVRTENNCVPRDIVALGPHLLFAYNTFIGLRPQTRVADVFSLHEFHQTADGFDFGPAPADANEGLLGDPRFVRDFEEIYSYYKEARLILLRRTSTRLLAIFQVGHTLRDIRVLRWDVDAGGRATYVDNRGERDHVFPPAHDFEWTQAGRDDQVRGKHPHMSILGEVFVDTSDGTLTIKVENNTAHGQGIYDEPVEDRRQSLDDAEFHYAKVGGLILLKILPYREKDFRYLVFNTRNKRVVRIDAIGQACVQLPEDQGILFPGGYYLQSGEYKLFDGDHSGYVFKRSIRAPNGEDVLYVFHRREDGHYLLLPYDVVHKQMRAAINAHGYSVFDDGRMVVFRAQGDEPTRIHPMQIWQSPFCREEPPPPEHVRGSFLAKVGNAELVRGIAETYSVARLAESAEPTRRTYEDLIASIRRCIDGYVWLAHAEAQGLRATLDEMARTADLVVQEFEKVQVLRQRASQALTTLETAQTEALGTLRPEDFRSIEEFVGALTRIRRQRGTIATNREVRYIDAARLDALDAEAVTAFDAVSAAAVSYLLLGQALSPLTDRITSLGDRIAEAKTTADVTPLAAELDEAAEGLSLLSEVIAGLQVDDPTARTRILEELSEVLGQQNRVRATLDTRRRDLRSHEGQAEFAAQFRLVSQSVESALAAASTPEACDAQMSRVLVQLEELETRFGEFDDFLAPLARKREEVQNAFAARRQSLLDARQRRVRAMLDAAERVLSGVQRRALSFTEEPELNAWFASDAMVLKLRQFASQLGELGAGVKGDELLTRLQTARQEALRQLRDRRELSDGDTSVVRFGQHRFHVHEQQVELTIVPHDGALSLHLTGTDFFERIDDPALADKRDFWDQTLVSESHDLYRAEYLAGSVLFDAEESRGRWTIQSLSDAITGEGGLLAVVRETASQRLDEGYERGVHDADAALILERLVHLRVGAGLLRYPPQARALAALYWAFLDDAGTRTLVHRQAVSLGRLRETFGRAPGFDAFVSDLATALADFASRWRLALPAEQVRLAADYLARELADEHPRFVLGAEARSLQQALERRLDSPSARRAFEEDLRALEGAPAEQFRLCAAWLRAAADESDETRAFENAIDEAAALLVTGSRLDREEDSAEIAAEVRGLLGQHPRVRNGTLHLRLDEFIARFARFRSERVPAFRAFVAARHEVLERARARLRIDELVAQTLSTFVRNQLINDVYLPLIANNFARQLGTADSGARTDRMGLLLLLSPPGYGKTTLMEYVASRLGLVFVKANGPALGHDVTSLDPAEAPNATARQEIERINFALEMGNNVMLYLDDIQHTNPELLQKFISLCDGQRRIEGVWRGRSRTYDLRGKRFCVVMAGNPYTETGERFRLPDMLANRADTYNLGDVIDGKEHLFAQSYVENALTSNAVLSPLATRDPADVRRFLRLSRGEDVPSTDFAHDYSGAERDEIVSVLQRLQRVQSVAMAVNREYVASAAQDDRFRTEPPFKLQGSYRNMNRMAARVVAAMNDDETERLIDDHYAGESQTLTSAAEHNLLKLAELRGRMTPEQKARWDEIKRGFARVQLMGGADDDPVARVTAQLQLLGDSIGAIGTAIETHASRPLPPPDTHGAELVHALQAISTTLQSTAARPSAPSDTRASVEAVRQLDQIRTSLQQLAAFAERSLSTAPREDSVAAARAVSLSIEKLESSLRQAVAAPRPVIAAPEGVLPADLARRLQLVAGALVPLVETAGRTLQSGNDSMKAMLVWQRVNEALELLRAD